MKTTIKVDDMEGYAEEKEFDSTDVAKYLERVERWLNNNFTIRTAVLDGIINHADYRSNEDSYISCYFGGYEDEYPVQITFTTEVK